MNPTMHSPISRPAHGPRVVRLANEHALADAVSGIVADAVSHAIAKRNCASLVFSGGGTPEKYLPQVANLTLPWKLVSILLADERWVSEDSPHSNTAMLRRLLLNRPGPAHARFVPYWNESPTALQGVDRLRTSLPPLDPPYSLVLLGMGNDGHFASLFPGTPGLADLLSASNTQRIAAIPAPATASPHVERVSMTLAELRRSERIVLVLQGEAKLAVLEQAWQAGDPLKTPVVALGDVEVLWCA